MATEDAQRALGSEVCAELAEYVARQALLAESEFSRLVRDLAADPNSILGGHRREALRSGLNFWYKEILRASSGSEPVVPPSRLVAFVASIPTCIAAVVAEVSAEFEATFHERQIALTLDLGGLQHQTAFATDDLVRDLVRHLLENADTHRSQDGSQRVMKIAIRVVEAPKVLEVVVRNTDSSPAARGHGVGRDRLMARLQGFGATLIDGPVREGEWTYEASATFLRLE